MLLIGYGGVDYYQNRNIDRTLQLVLQIREKAREIKEEANYLAEYLEAYFSGRTEKIQTDGSGISLDQIPEYTGKPYVCINDNVPEFNEDERNSGAFEYYSELDALGRCNMAEAMISTELMPTEERGEIGMVMPPGWHTVKYDIIDGMYLYNRCHLIAFELTGENANEKNLITGTRYMNVCGMLPWENMIAQYIRNTNDMVLYRVTPIYDENNLVASGVHMEAESIQSDEICFNIYVYNVQPGIGIDYSNGDSWLE